MSKILNLKEKYPFLCPCGLQSNFQPSLCQSVMQSNNGRVYCPQCKGTFLVKIDSNNEEMIITTLEDVKAELNEHLNLPDSCYRDATKEEEIIINKRKL